MVRRKQPPRPPEQRAAENQAFYERRREIGVVKVSVMVPADRVSELRAISLAWRAEAKLLLESDRPSADQILQIHAVCRTLGIELPIQAFETRASAAYWLLAHESKLAGRRVQMPTSRPVPQR